MEYIYKVVRTNDHTFVYAIFDRKMEATAYAEHKNQYANCNLTKVITETMDEDIFNDLFYPKGD